MMTDTHGSETHAGPRVGAYFMVFGALAVFTLVSFVVNSAERADGMFHRAVIATHTGFVILMLVAVCKTTLVGMFFMHLKFDWSRFYFIIIPAFFLGTILIVVLLPDVVLAWKQ